MNKYLNYAKAYNSEEKVQTWIKTNLNNYLKTNPENQTEIEHIIDYLLSDKCPKNIHKMSYKEAKTNTDKWNKALIKKGNEPQKVNNFSKRGQKKNGDLIYLSQCKKCGSADQKVRDGKKLAHVCECGKKISREAKTCVSCRRKTGNIHPRFIVRNYGRDDIAITSRSCSISGEA